MRTKSFLIALVAMMLPMAVSAETVEIDGICYNLIAKGQVAEVVKGKYPGEVNILSSVKYQGIDYCVTSIGDQAFSYCRGLTSVTIPNSVTSIGDQAFSYCRDLTSVTIPNSVTKIGSYAFESSGLTSITIPNSVTSIGDQAFKDCSSLISVDISDLTAWCNIKFSRYDSNPLYYAHHLYINGNEITNLVIPNDLTSIDNYVFSGCRGLTSVNIPNSVTSIGDYAFSGCGFTSVTIPNSVTSIGNFAFYGCSLTSVIIPNSVTAISEHAFSYCGSLTSVTIPNSVTAIGSYAFSYCGSLTSVTIPNSVRAIGSYAFWNCCGLTSITIPNSVTVIGSFAFCNCDGLTSVTIPNSVTSINGSAFYECTKLTSIELGKSIKYIHSRAFANCENLTNVVCLAKSVPTTSQDAFENSYIEYVSLHVYESSIEEYKKQEPWASIKTIVAADIPMNTLTYMIDGEVYKTTKYEEGETIIPEKVPEKEGYSFSGWEGLPKTMPGEDLTVKGLFSINKYKLTYLVDEEIYKEYDIKFGSTIIPESDPQKEGYSFSGWSEIPEEMPAHDVMITGTFTRDPLGKCASPIINIINGELVFGCEIDDVEYHYDIQHLDVKSGEGNQIKLVNTYRISVYASKDGYEDSDVTTKDFQFAVGKKGDIDGDGNVNAADVVQLTNIIMLEAE